MTLAKLHLRVLLAFTKNKTNECAQKLYQLRVMDFLVREVQAEYTARFAFVGRSRAESVVSAPVVGKFLKDLEAKTAAQRAAEEAAGGSATERKRKARRSIGRTQSTRTIEEDDGTRVARER